MELGALVGRRPDTNDAHAVSLVFSRQLVVAEQAPGDNRDVEVVGKRLTQLGEQMGGRPTPRPEDLVENKDLGPAGTHPAERKRLGRGRPGLSGSAAEPGRLGRTPGLRGPWSPP